jgi:hypothetical protein
MLAFLWILTAEIAPERRRRRRRACCIYRLYFAIAEMAHILTIFYVYRNNFDGGQKEKKQHSFTIQNNPERRRAGASYM